MFYTIYKTTNQINGKIYIGSHKTKNLDDGYLGSGKYLIRAVEKLGVENFEKEILFVFDNPEDMYAKEAELVNEDFLAEENTYNLKVGGFGGFDYLNSSAFQNPSHSSTHAKMMSDAGYDARYKALEECRKDPEWVDKLSKNLSVGQKRRFETSTGTFRGKSHTEESKRKIGSKNSKNQRGSNNSQFGKPKSEAAKEKLRTFLRNRPILICPHCCIENKNKGAMVRHHFDNCKQALPPK